MLRRKNKKLKYILFIVLAILLLVNYIFAVQAYRFTHFNEEPTALEVDSSSYTSIKTLLCGVNIPKPKSSTYPVGNYDSLVIYTTKTDSLFAWKIKSMQDSIRGMVILFHGYMSQKSQMLPYASEIVDMGYDVLLVDFRAAGLSSGNQCTMGILEAEDVRLVVDYAKNTLLQDKIILYGFSMGAVAVIKAQSEYQLPIAGIIAEAPYNNFKTAIRNRATLVGAGIFAEPAAYVFCSWLSLTNLLNPFAMSPEEYARKITVPALLAYGVQDQYITADETLRIYDNLGSEKKYLKSYDTRHEIYIHKFREEWEQSVRDFLEEVK